MDTAAPTRCLLFLVFRMISGVTHSPISSRPDASIFWTQSRCQILSTLVKKCGCSQVVKMMEKINNMGGTSEPAGEVPCCFAWATIHQVLKLLGNLFLYPFSHVVEQWPGRPVGKGNGLSVCFLGGTVFICFSGREDLNKLAFARTRMKKPNNCWFSSVFYSS